MTVNNGSVATLRDGTITKTGSAATSASCYCPSVSGGTLSWGGQQACGSACGNGGLAGKFVEIHAERTYKPFFINYGIGVNGTVSSRAVVQTQ